MNRVDVVAGPSSSENTTPRSLNRFHHITDFTNRSQIRGRIQRFVLGDRTLSLPTPALSFPLEVGSSLNQLRGLGEHCKLPWVPR